MARANEQKRCRSFGVSHAPGMPALILALALLTGLAVVALETIWMRVPALDMGSSMRAVSLVVAFFIGGAVEQDLGARAQQRGLPDLRWFAGTMTLLSTLAWLLRPMIAPLLASSPLPAWCSDSILALLMIGAPALLAATGFPALVQALIRELEQRGRLGGWLASMDRLGAVLGVLLPQAFGYAITFWICIAVLLIVAGVAWLQATQAYRKSPFYDFLTEAQRRSGLVREVGSVSGLPGIVHASLAPTLFSDRHTH